MKIQIQNFEQRVKDEVDRCVGEIRGNAEKGVTITALSIPLDLSGTVRAALETQVENLYFMSTGNGNGEISETYGGNRHYRAKLY
jgi:hypothetical protein